MSKRKVERSSAQTASKNLVQVNETVGVEPMIHFAVPNKESAGFLRRQRQALEFSEKLKSTEGITSQTIDGLVDFLLPFVTKPVKRDEAREALLDMSEAQFDAMLRVIVGGKENTPLAKSAPIERG